MMIKYATITKIGRRQKNEDSIYPNPLHNRLVDSNLFIVCDGVGGAVKGEIASSIACTVIASFFREIIKDKESTEMDIEASIRCAEKSISFFVSNNKEGKGMATTLALLHLHKNGATISHAGDSRVYHIRNGEILFQTRDHKLVNEWVISGYITEKEAENHAKKNVITRAITEGQECTKADLQNINDLRSKDFFLLCSDGILEGVDEGFIRVNFLTGVNPENIIDKIDKVCCEKSNDNYSAIVVGL